MGCGTSSSTQTVPPVQVQLGGLVPEELQVMPAGKDPALAQSLSGDTSGSMLCAQCRCALQPIVAPVVKCSNCGVLCISGRFQGEVQISVVVPADVGSGGPFVVSMDEKDGRRVLVVPPVAVLAGTTLDIVVPGLKKGCTVARLGGADCHLEGRVVGIQLLSVAATRNTGQGQPNTLQQPPSSGQPQTSALGIGSSLLKGAAGAAASSLGGAASDALAKVPGQAKPTAQLLPSNVQYAGPVGLAAKASMLAANIKCSACGSELKASSTTPVFRCGCCGVLSTFPAMQGETVYTVKTPMAHRGGDFFLEATDGRLVLIEWPVRNMGGRQLAIAVPPKGANFGEMLMGAFGVVCFVLDPIGSALDAGFQAAVEGRKPDCKGRVVDVYA